MQHDPYRLRPELKRLMKVMPCVTSGMTIKELTHVADEQRNAEAHFERQRHDRRFDGEEQERERGVDQRGDGRADDSRSRRRG